MRIGNLFGKTSVLLMAGYLFVQCGPMNDENWEYNSLIHLDWIDANPETEQRPIEIEDINAYFFPQDDVSPLIKEKMNRSVAQFNVPDNCYDILVVQGGISVERTERFKTTTLVLPTHFNEEGERVITTNPEYMNYAGKVMNEIVSFDKKSNVVVPMERLFRRLVVVAEIIDEGEIKKPCNVNLSGLAYKKKIWSNSYEEDADAVQIFDLTKQGRFLNEKKYLNEFKGDIYSLGTTGLNILYFTFFDSKDKEHFIKCDISSYMANWNDYELTVKIRVDVTQESIKFHIVGWNEEEDFNYVVKY